MSAQGWRFRHPGTEQILFSINAESIGKWRLSLANAFSVVVFLMLLSPGLCQPWAEIRQRLRRLDTSREVQTDRARVCHYSTESIDRLNTQVYITAVIKSLTLLILTTSPIARRANSRSDNPSH